MHKANKVVAEEPILRLAKENKILKSIILSGQKRRNNKQIIKRRVKDKQNFYSAQPTYAVAGLWICTLKITFWKYLTCKEWQSSHLKSKSTMLQEQKHPLQTSSLCHSSNNYFSHSRFSILKEDTTPLHTSNKSSSSN